MGERAAYLDDMLWPRPTVPALFALHAAYMVPLLALAVWFGLIDRLPFGEGRCSSCGVEGYVIAAQSPPRSGWARSSRARPRRESRPATAGARPAPAPSGCWPPSACSC